MKLFDLSRAAARALAVSLALLVVLAGAGRAADDPTPPPKVTGGQWSLVMIPDPQAYTQNYGGADGYLYEGRFDKQTEWAAANIETLNIRFVTVVGDNVQNFARDAGEWRLAVRALDLLHQGKDPDRPAVLPYGVACGNHDYDSSAKDSLASTTYEKHLGPGRFRGADGRIKEAVAQWYRGDDRGWKYTVNGETRATGVGRNSYQLFSAGGREFLHLTLETAVTDQGIAWAKSVLAAQPGKPTIVTTHAFIDGGGRLLPRERMGRNALGPNPTNDAQGIFDKLIRESDQIFLVLCGHMYFQARLVLKNAKGHDVHILESCYHLNKVGGRVFNQQAPKGGWPSGYKGPDDTQRNGSGWLVVLVFDLERKSITRYTYSPLLGVWATDLVAPPYENRTFPEGDNVIEQFEFDFQGRFG